MGSELRTMRLPLKIAKISLSGIARTIVKALSGILQRSPLTGSAKLCSGFVSSEHFILQAIFLTQREDFQHRMAV